MRVKQVIAAFLLAVGLCLVPALGYGELRVLLREKKDLPMEVELLKAQVNYLMNNPTPSLAIKFFYFPDPEGDIGIAIPPGGLRLLPGNRLPSNKLYILITDNSGAWYNWSGVVLLDQFKRTLEYTYSYIENLATDMDNDIVAQFFSQERIPLGYFDQGEYLLWGE